MEIHKLIYRTNGYVAVEVTGDIDALIELGPLHPPGDEEELEELRHDPERVLAFRFLQRGEVIGKIAVRIGRSREEVGEAVERYLTRLG